MMLNRKCFLLLVALYLTVPVPSICFDLNEALTFAVRQYTQLSEQLSEDDISSGFITTGDPLQSTWTKNNFGEWTVGFYGGSLWTLFALTNDGYWKTLAEEFQERVKGRQFDTSTHDVGFVIMSTFGLCREYTGNVDETVPVIEQSSKSLSERFNPQARVLRSWDNWDGVNDEDEIKVIADNIMNLELLYTATNLTGNVTFGEIADAHADRTFQEHFRNNGRSGVYHVVAYSEETGEVLRKFNVQGLRDNSTWSRALAWTTHGYVTSFVLSKHQRFLEYAIIAGEYFISNLPDDFVPYWDFDADIMTAYQPRDTAAAAIAAHAFLKIFQVTRDVKWFHVAENILTNLNTKYRSDGKDVYKIHSILVNGTVHYRDGNFNTAIVYADFYFLQAIKLYREITDDSTNNGVLVPVSTSLGFLCLLALKIVSTSSL